MNLTENKYLVCKMAMIFFGRNMLISFVNGQGHCMCLRKFSGIILTEYTCGIILALHEVGVLHMLYRPSLAPASKLHWDGH